MDSNFWLERWAKHEIGFHQARTNDYLVEYWPRLGIPDDATVFVPLCGKTLDMRWLRERGHRVLGVELARTACEEFFAEWGVVPDVTRSGKFDRFEARGITLLCGDFLDLTSEDVREVRATFDRAALIALPPPLRRAYVQRLREILPPQTTILLIAPEYDQRQMNGPPFAVGLEEIHALFSGMRIETLASVDVTDSPDGARFRQRGLTRLVERAVRID
jgi:thiopurine S-methyltransferase